MELVLYLDDNLVKAQDPSKPQTPKPPQPTAPQQATPQATPASTPGTQPQQQPTGSDQAPKTSGGQKSNIDWNSHYVWDQSKGPPPQGAVQYTKRDGSVGYAVPHGAGSPAATEPAEGTDKPSEPAEEETRAHSHYSKFVQPDETKASPGVFSVNPEDYAEDSDPLSHYKIAQYHGKTGYSEGEVGHKKIARERMKGATPEDHMEMASQLKEMGYHEDAAWHQNKAQQMSYKPPTPGEMDERTAESQQYTPPTPDEMDERRGVSPEEKQPAQEYTPPTPGEMDQRVANAEFDQQDKEGKNTQFARIEERYKDWSADDLERAASGKKSGKASSRDPDGLTQQGRVLMNMARKKRKEEHQQHTSALEEHQAKVKDHEEQKPEKPEPFTELPPQSTGDKKKDAAAKLAFDKKKREHKKKELKHKADLHRWTKRRDQLKKEEKDLSSKVKDAEKHVKTAEKQEKAEQKQQEQAAAEQPKVPETDVEHAQVAAHKASAQKLVESIQAHLDAGQLDDPTRETLEKVHSAAQEHLDIQHVPQKEQSGQLKELQKLAGEHGKKPPEEEGDPGMEQSAAPERQNKLNLKRIASSASAAGAAVGRAALHGETAGAIGGMALDYAGRGVVSAGHSLLDKYQDSKIAKQDATRQAEEQAAKDSAEGGDTDRTPAPKKKAGEEEQASMGKSLSLYLDLAKAVSQTPNVGVTPKKEKRARVEHESSYATQHTGVASEGIVTEDDPDVGRKWRHDDDDSVQAQVDSELEEEEDENKDNAKSVGMAVEMVKSLSSALSREAKRYRPTDLEDQFMREVMGLPDEVVSKGLGKITGRYRHAFNEWTHSRLSKSINSLLGVSYE